MQCRALACWSGAPRVATVGIPSAGCCGRPWGRRFASASRPLHGFCPRVLRPPRSSSRNSIACRRRSSTAWLRRTGCPFLRYASGHRSTRACGTTCTRALRFCRGTSIAICGRRSGCGVRRGAPRAMCASEPAARRLPVNGLVVAAPAPLAVVHDCAWPERRARSEEHTSELQSHSDLVCRLLLEKKKKKINKKPQNHTPCAACLHHLPHLPP